MFAILRFFRMIGLILVLAAAIALDLPYSDGRAAAKGTTLYDPDPQHLWNRLHDALRVRLTTELRGEFRGEEFLLEAEDAKADADELDPMLWSLTWHYSKYLLTGPADARYDALIRKTPKLRKYPRKSRDAHREALALLNEFLDKRGEKLIRDPLRRSLLQRDLWALFDCFADPIWSHWWSGPDSKEPSPSLFRRERRALLSRLAKILPRLALSREQIRRLPDNYAAAVKAGTSPTVFDPRRKGAAFLPSDLQQEDGPWVLLKEAIDQPLARDHTRFFGGRSVFLVFLRLPGGRRQTLDYVKRLQEGAQKIAKDVAYPSFPAQTQVALVRRTLLLDDRGDIIPSPLTETVQIRVYLDPKRELTEQNAAEVQTFIEHRLRRRDLLAGKAGGLSPVGPSERERDEMLFFGHNHESGRQPILASCMNCHREPGIESVNSYTGRSFFDSHGKASLYPSTPADEGRVTVNWKKRQYTWGLLEGLWINRPSE